MGLNVSLSNICVKYNKSDFVLSNICLKVKSGSSLALVGDSGCGKTTLLNVICGLERPFKGSVFLGEKNIEHLKPDELDSLRCCELGFVFQTFHLIPHLTVLQNIMIPGLIKGTDFSILNNKIHNLLDSLDLIHRKNSFPSDISGGEKQRACIARSLVNEPKIILADEPTGNLDQKNTKKVIDLLLEKSTENKVTLIVATHSMEIAKKMDKTMLLNFDGLENFNSF